MDLKTKPYPVVFCVLLFGISVMIAVLFSGCMQPMDSDGLQTSFWYSFEEDMQGWQINGTDLVDPPINWSVNRSDAYAVNGSYAVRLYLDNVNDAGKIWMEKVFAAQPNQLYLVMVSYQFATADFGDFNLFNLITTVSGDGFFDRDDLNYEDDTGHHTDAEGYVWLEKSFEYFVETDENGEIYINIGVWGSWETSRMYYVDAVNISFMVQEKIEQYPTVSGVWTVKHYNYEGNQTGEENVTIVQDEGLVVFQFDFATVVQGRIVKNADRNPYRDSAFVIKGIDFRGLGIDTIYIVDESSMITEIPLCESCNPSVFTR